MSALAPRPFLARLCIHVVTATILRLRTPSSTASFPSYPILKPTLRRRRSLLGVAAVVSFTVELSLAASSFTSVDEVLSQVTTTMGQVEADSAQLIAGIKGSSNNVMWDSVTGVSATTAAKSTTSGASASSGDGDGDGDGGGGGGTVAAIVITLLLGGLMGGYTVAKAKGKVGVVKPVKDAHLHTRLHAHAARLQPPPLAV